MVAVGLRWARKRLHLTQAELAEAIGMQRNSITRMENGTTPVMKHTELSVKYLLLTRKGGKKHGNK